MFADRYHHEIDWNKLRELLGEVNAFDYTRALFYILNRYLLPEAAFMPDIREWNIDEIDEEPLLLDILESGTLGASSLSRLHSSNITLNAATDGKRGNGVLHTVFLPLESMKGRYPYLEKAPFLLPVAWMQRIFTYLKEVKQTPSNDTGESIRIGRERVELLRKYHIMKGK